MRKMIYVSLMLLAVVGAIAVSAPKSEAAFFTCLNPGPNCTCRCQCGQLLRCCSSGGVTTCQPIFDPNLLCPQVAC